MSSSSTTSRSTIGAYAGMSGAALFVLLFSLEGWLRPDYSPRAQYVSELALGARGWVQTANFLLSGALILLFAWGCVPVFANGRGAKAAPIIFALIGAGLFLSGFFAMDPFDTLRAEWSLHGTIHQLLGALVFALMPAVCIVLARRFRVDPLWRAYFASTVVIVAILLVAIVVLRVGPSMPPAAPTALNPWRGFIQRLILIPFMAWLFTVAWKMRWLAIPRGD